MTIHVSALLVVASGILAPQQPGQSQSLQDFSIGLQSPQPVTIYSAKEVITLDPAKPTVTAVAVQGDRIVGTGTSEELRAKFGKLVTKVDTKFRNNVIVPGLIAQHDHPLLAALTMTSDIIAIEDWVLPEGVSKAAKNREEYLARLTALHKKASDPNKLILTWGYHQYFHGKLTREDVNKISKTRPIIVWHRSAHEFILNDGAIKKYNVTREWYDKLSESAKKQSNFENGHYWEQGAFAVGPLIIGGIASPDRVSKGLKFVKDYYHANGVTLGCEPGGIAGKAVQDAQNAVLGDASSPFRFYYMVDGKSVTATVKDDQVGPESAKFLTWGKGMTAYLPNQVKLFADGAIYSQAMQLTKPYSDGHKGEWMMDPDFFARSFRIYWDLGYQLHCHVNGDAGLDLVLDRLEENLKRNPRKNHRTVIIHFAVSRPEQVARIKELGAIVSGNPYYPVALADNYRTNGMDAERADPMVRMGDVERAGISYSFHSDMPMAPGQPLFLMDCGVNRITPAGNLRAPDQRVSRLGALKAVTLEAAYSLQLEDQVGSIVPGKLANLTILNGNPLTCEPTQIKDIKVWGTVHEGRVLPVKGGKVAKQLGPDRSKQSLAAHALAWNHEATQSARAGTDEHGHAADSCLVNQLLGKLISKR